MNEMIERVAMTMARYWHVIPAISEEEFAPIWNNWHPQAKAPWISAARLVIEAMDEPTEAMHNAARDWSREKYGKPIGIDASAGCWKAMQAAALR